MSSTPDPGDRPDTGEMVVIHRVFRREFTSLPALIRGVADGDLARSALVGEHVQQMLFFLDTHHRGEDELIWPLLNERATLHADLVDRMEGQHQVVAALISKTNEQLAPWITAPSTATGDVLASLIEDIASALFEHLDDEEQFVLPLIAEHLSPAEWAKLGAHGRSSLTSPKQQMQILGAILEQATADERARMFAPLPPPVRDAWTAQGQPAYDSYIAEVRGS